MERCYEDQTAACLTQIVTAHRMSPLELPQSIKCQFISER